MHRSALPFDVPYTYVPAVNDIVEISGGSRMIVIDIIRTRPSNPYLGVLEGGKGKKYKFGPRHHPRKVGTADKSHPALMALQQRTQEITGVSADYKALVQRLCIAIENGQLETAKTLAGILKTL